TGAPPPQGEAKDLRTKADNHILMYLYHSLFALSRQQPLRPGENRCKLGVFLKPIMPKKEFSE
ncbi:MAG: hypothetical protein RSC08_07950, partial [Oscillospiraceae bacterium]